MFPFTSVNRMRRGLRTPPLVGFALMQASILGHAAAAAPSTAEAPAQTGGELFSELFFLKLGFSFMIGLAMGFALKIAFKIALFVIGLIVLALFGLQFAGIADVNWSGLEMHYDGWAAWMGASASTFFGFAGDNLTSAASFLAGLAVGLRF